MDAQTSRLSIVDLILYRNAIKTNSPELLEEYDSDIERQTGLIIPNSRLTLPCRKLIIPKGSKAQRIIILPLLFLCLTTQTSASIIYSNWAEPTQWGRLSDQTYRGQAFDIDEPSTLKEVGFYLGNTKGDVATLYLIDLRTETFLLSQEFPIASHFDLEPYAVPLDVSLDAGTYAFLLNGPAYVGYGGDFPTDSILYKTNSLPKIQVRPQDLVFYAMMDPPLCEPDSFRIWMINAGFFLVVLGRKLREGNCV